MSLPAAWVDRIFAKLAVRYGEAFMRQYGGLDIDAVRADWAEELDGFDGESIAYGLRFLPAERPPNVMQFRDQCRRSPPKQQAIAYDHQAADPAIAAKVRQAFVGRRGSGPRAWAEQLRQRHERGEKLSAFQVEAYQRALSAGMVLPEDA